MLEICRCNVTRDDRVIDEHTTCVDRTGTWPRAGVQCHRAVGKCYVVCGNRTTAAGGVARNRAIDQRHVTAVDAPPDAAVLQITVLLTNRKLGAEMASSERSGPQELPYLRECWRHCFPKRCSIVASTDR